MDIYKSFPRGILHRGLEQHHTPYAAWMEPEVIKRYAIDPKRIGKDPILGKVDSGYIAIPDDRMMAIVSGSRGGKGRGFLVPFMLSYPGSIVCPSDCKGELVSLAVRHRAEEMGQRLIVLDPFGIVTDPALQKYKNNFNLMAPIREDNPFAVEDAGLISDALCIASGTGNDLHWTESGMTILDGLILHVASDPAFAGKRDLVTVRHLLTHGIECGDEQGMMGLYGHMLMNEAFDGVVQAAAADCFERPPQERGGVFSTARRATKFIDYKSMTSVLRGENDFTFDELKENPHGVTVMLCLPTNRLLSCNRWLRAFLQVCLSKLEQCPTRPRYPVVMLLEEFANAIGYLKNIEVAGTLMAGHDVRLIYVLQGIGQLQALYKDGWEAMLGSCGTQLYFSNADLTTTEYLGRRLGKTSMNVERDSASTPEQWQKGTGAGRSSGVEQCDLMTAEEIARFFAREQNRVLVLQSGHDPMALERMAYDKEKIFEGKYDAWR